jgi:hypothetical protein
MSDRKERTANSGLQKLQICKIDKFLSQEFYLSRKLYGPRVKQLCKPPLPADSNRKKQTENTN